MISKGINGPTLQRHFTFLVRVHSFVDTAKQLLIRIGFSINFARLNTEKMEFYTCKNNIFQGPAWSTHFIYLTVQ
jgi:ribosome biogenesis protein Tsr3